MSRKATWPPRVTRHASGQARVSWRSKDYYLGPHGSVEADEAYVRLLAELAEARHGQSPPPAVAPAAPTVACVARAWLAGPYRDCSEKERSHYAHAVGVMLAECGRLRAAAFDARALSRVRARMTGRLSWSRGHANRQTVRLRTVWRWAEREALVPRGSWEHLRTLGAIPAHDRGVRQTARVRPCTWEELCLVVARCRPAVGAMLLLQWHSGMRPGEACRVRAGDVDRSGDVWVYTPHRHKGSWRDQPRHVPLGPAAQAVLAPWLGRPGYLFRPAPRHGRCAARYNGETYAQYVRRAALRAGVPDFHAYRLRHAFRLRVTRELGLDFARSAMGHTSIGTTNEYAKGADLALACDAARRCG